MHTYLAENETKAADVRIENDFNLAYPVGKSDEIVAYLKAKYVDDSHFVESLGPKYKGALGDEDFTDTYFDTKQLQLYKRLAGLRHRRRLNRLDASNRKNGRELIQLKLSGSDKLLGQDDGRARNEIKFKVLPPHRLKTVADVNPLLHMMSAKNQETLRAALEKIDVDPMALKPILTLKQHRRRVYINNDKGTFVSFSMDDVEANLWTRHIVYSQLEGELNELEYTEADPAERARMSGLRQGMIRDLRAQFPYLQDDQSIKYTKAFDRLAQKIPGLKLWVRLDLLQNKAPESLVPKHQKKSESNDGEN